MKKHIYALAIFAALSLSLTACSEPNDTGETSYNEYSVQTESKALVTTSEKDGDVEDIEITAVTDVSVVADVVDVTEVSEIAEITEIGDIADDDTDNTAVFEDDVDDIYDTDVASHFDPFGDDSQTEPYFEEHSDTAVSRVTEVFIDHTEPVPGESGVGDIPQ